MNSTRGLEKLLVPKGLLTFWFIIFLTACKYPNKQENNGMEIAWPPIPESEIQLSSLFESIDYLILPGNDEIFIGNIDKVIQKDSLFFILDKELMNTLLIYSLKENFIGKIEPGPGAEGEILGIEDFDVDDEKKIIYVLENTGKRIFKYTYSGNYISTLQPDILINGLSWDKTGKSIIGFRNINPNTSDQSGKNRLVQIAEDGRIISTFFPFDDRDFYLNFHSPAKPFTSFKNRLFFSNTISGETFELKNGRAEIYLNFDYGRLGLKQTLRKMNNHPESLLNAFNDADDYVMSLPLNFYFGSKWFGICRTKNAMSWFILDEKTGKLITSKKLINDLDGLPVFPPVGQNDDEVFISIHPDFLMGMIQNSGSENLPLELFEKLNGFEISEINPVLMRLKIKAFETF